MKPSWKQAPKWAGYLGYKDGKWYWVSLQTYTVESVEKATKQQVNRINMKLEKRP